MIFTWWTLDTGHYYFLGKLFKECAKGAKDAENGRVFIVDTGRPLCGLFVVLARNNIRDFSSPPHLTIALSNLQLLNVLALRRAPRAGIEDN